MRSKLEVMKYEATLTGGGYYPPKITYILFIADNVRSPEYPLPRNFIILPVRLRAVRRSSAENYFSSSPFLYSSLIWSIVKTEDQYWNPFISPLSLLL